MTNHPNRSKARKLADAVRVHLATAPVFRLRPIGAPGSIARLDQEDRIVSEDALKAALADYEGTTP